MLAVVRARFPGETTAHWSDAAMHAWFDPSIEFSLAHFLTKSSFHQFDMSYQLFSPIQVQDRRADPAYGADPKERLLRGVLEVLTNEFDPNWDVLDRIFVCFAGHIEAMYGGGSGVLIPPRPAPNTSHPYKRTHIVGAVIDSDAPFDGICQEVGHAFGLNHEFNHTIEYGCPYSAMSATTYVGRNPNFVRPVDPRLPTGGMPWAGHNCYGLTNDVQRVIGPYIPAVHFFLSTPGFVHPDSVFNLPATYAQVPLNFRLDALDVGVDSWPTRKRVLAVLPSLNGLDPLFLELRRPAGYDRALKASIGAAGTSELPAGICIYSYNFPSRKITFEECIPISQESGDKDFHSARTGVTIRLNGSAPDLAWANVTVGGGDFWNHFGVSLNVFDTVSLVPPLEAWRTVRAKPCPRYPAKDYRMRYHHQRTEFAIQANSYGYEQPVYKWFLNNVELSPGQASVSLQVGAQESVDGVDQASKLELLKFDYQLTQARLRLSSAAARNGIELQLRVTVDESAPSVNRSLYPPRTSTTNLFIDNYEVEWDDDYIRDFQRCWSDFLKAVNFQVAVNPADVPRKVDPTPKFSEVTVNSLVRHLSTNHPAAAKQVVGEISKLTGVSKFEVMRRYLTE